MEGRIALAYYRVFLEHNRYEYGFTTWEGNADSPLEAEKLAEEAKFNYIAVIGYTTIMDKAKSLSRPTDN